MVNTSDYRSCQAASYKFSSSSACWALAIYGGLVRPPQRRGALRRWRARAAATYGGRDRTSGLVRVCSSVPEGDSCAAGWISDDGARLSVSFACPVLGESW